MEHNSEKNMILKGNLWQMMFKLSWPAVVAMMLYGLNTVFDAIFVGRFVGETALAGVSLAYPLTQISLGLGSLIGVGAGSALSIALGGDDKETQRKLLGNVNYLTLVIGIVFMVIGIFFAEGLVKIMGGSGEELILGADYFRVTLYGAIFWIGGLAGNMIVRAEGKMKSAAVMMAIGLIVNIVANYLFIVVFEFGVKGAAYGTNIGMIVYTISAFAYFSRKKASFDAKPFSIKRDKTIIKSIISLGMPSLIMTVMSLIQAIVVLNAITHVGTTTDVAFYGVVFRIFTFLLTPIFGLMRALQPAIGINYGAKDYERVIGSFRVFAVAASLILLPCWLFMMISPESALHLMMPDKIFTAADLFNMRIFMLLLPILPVIFMGMTLFPATNDPKPAALIGIVRQLIFYVPVMLIVPRMFGISWVYIGAFIIDTIMTLWVVYLVKKKFKQLRRSEEKIETRVESIN